jgi:hypothetical protein
MLIQILQRTPLWVWALLVGLMALGFAQTKDRVLNSRRLILTPLAMTAFSLYGTISAFGPSVATFVPWLAAFTATAILIVLASNADHIRYDRASKRFAVPGSWVPMGVILAIFLTKYATGVLLSMQPDRAHDATFALGLCLLYGLFSGFFVGRVITVCRRAWQR